MERTDVLVVGAGPSGLVAALLLALHRVPFRIVDRKPAVSENSRAVGIQARTLEVFEQLGVVDEFLARGRRATGIDFHTPRGLVRVDLFGAAWMDTAYPFVLLLEQSRTETILLRRLRTLGHDVEWETEVVGVEPREGEATVTVRRPGGAEAAVAARWVVAADGAGSVVREAVGVPFTGSTYEQRFLVADVDAAEGRLDPRRINVSLNDAGFALLLPLSAEDGSFRLATSEPREARGREEEPRFEDVQRQVDRVFPGGLRVARPRWLTRFRIHSRSVDRFRQGPVFLAGDAAHIHSPVGGQGMNTGVQDAHGLVWRLALVARGALPPAALDTYDAERRPIARALLRTTDRAFRLIDRQDLAARFLRVHVWPRLAGALVRVPPLRRRAARTISQIGIRHSAGLFVPDGGHGFPRSAPRAGERFPTLGSWTPSLLQDGRHALLLVAWTARSRAEAGTTRAAVAATRTETVAVHFIEGIARLVGREGAAYLVRPDGYVGTRVPSVRPEEVGRCLDAYFAGNGWAG